MTKTKLQSELEACRKEKEHFSQEYEAMQDNMNFITRQERKRRET